MYPAIDLDFVSSAKRTIASSLTTGAIIISGQWKNPQDRILQCCGSSVLPLVRGDNLLT
jgi:hypothetical protein